MNSFIRYLKIFKWIAMIFLGLIALLVIPASLMEQNYLQATLVATIMAFILTILFSLDRFFRTMAVDLHVDDNKVTFIYTDGCSKTEDIAELMQIKTTAYRHVFYMKNTQPVSLLRIDAPFSVRKDLDAVVGSVNNGLSI